MSDQNRPFNNTTFNPNINSFSLDEDQNVSYEMAPPENLDTDPSGPYYVPDVQLGGAEQQPSGLLFGLDEPLDFGMPPAWQPDLLEPGLSTSFNDQGPSGSINQNSEMDGTLEHWRQNHEFYESTFQDVVNNLPAPQQNDLGMTNPLQEVERWNAEHPWPDAMFQFPLDPSLAAQQEQPIMPQDGVAAGANPNQESDGVNPRSFEVDRNDPSMITSTTGDIRQASQNGSVFHTSSTHPSDTTPPNTTAPRRDHREPDLDLTSVQQPVVQRVTPAAIPTDGQAADRVDEGFIPEGIVDTMSEAELRDYTRDLIRANNLRIRTQIYVRRLRDNRPGSSSGSLPNPAASGSSNGSKVTGSSSLSGNPLQAATPCPATGSSAVAGSKRKRSRDDDDDDAAVREVLRRRRQKELVENEDEDEDLDVRTEVDDQDDSASNPQKKRTKTTPAATNATNAGTTKKQRKQGGPSGTNPRCNLRLTGTHQPPYNRFPGLASGRTAPQQLVRDHPRLINGGTALAIRHALAASSGSGRCDGNDLAPLFDRQYNVNGTYVRQIFSKAKAAQAQHAKDNPDLRPRCNHCTEWFRECSLRRNANGTIPCEECIEEGLQATCVLAAQPSASDAPSPAEG